MKQELVLIRGSNDNDAITSEDENIHGLLKQPLKLKHRDILLSHSRKHKEAKLLDMSKCDDYSLKNIRIYLNSERYSYNDLYLDFENNKFATLYEMFANLQESYYSHKNNQPIFSPTEFKRHAPISHIDYSRQKEALQTESIVMRIEFETEQSTSTETTAYCLKIT
ncbi:hypothetical protein NQ314_008937 [Rhamnusium bicolor]|uniref:Double jelly roll-like domain-containing protein n=1 Tax=Rhamnusium bicolor TaxID=1586634 RepID=A0AAV8Y5Q9_9CUCU|nr:hypothetical protein NQ314_008937 [Rhamnusium bicolor]